MSKLTGVGIDTLRAWERRYGAVTPTRDDRGRLYSDGDVRRVRLLRDAVAHGHAIGRIATLEASDLERLASSATAARSKELPAHPRTGIDTTSIIRALERFDTAGIEATLGRAAAMLTPVELLQDVVGPVMTEVGDARRARRISVANEHFMSAVIRNVLGSLLRVYGRPRSAVRVLLATPEYEPHEFGVLGAALLVASGGLDAIYLGPELPAADLADCAAAAQADVVVLGITAAENGDAIQQEVVEIARRLPKDIELWLGGRAAERMGAAIRPRALVVNDYEMLQAQLDRVRGL